MSDSSLSPSELRELTWGWWLALLIGVVSIVAGVIVIAKPSNSLSTLAVIFGIFILVDGIVELVAALSGETQERNATLNYRSVLARELTVEDARLYRKPSRHRRSPESATGG